MADKVKTHLDRIESLLTASVKDVISKELDRFGDSSAPDINNILTIEDVCTLTGLSKARIYTLCSHREIPHFKQGKLYFRRKEVENWLTAKDSPHVRRWRARQRCIAIRTKDNQSIYVHS